MNQDQDDSDDDFGPMPLPAGESGPAKKRKSECGCERAQLCWLYCQHCTEVGHADDSVSLSTALPHEKLYLDHLPSADRYWKSFMHRDTVTGVAVTK